MLMILALFACNGDSTEDCAETWYLDFDGDGFGGADFPLDACDAPDGYVDNADDCDDADSLTFPGGEELCNGLDDDCDGTVDNGASDALVFYGDGDGDGFGSLDDTVDACEAPEGYVDVSTDCDDGDGTLSPGTPEVCDGIDNDCDGQIDFDGWIPADFDSFADAAESADDGAHICVSPGDYHEANIELEKSITFEGSGDVELSGGGSWLFAHYDDDHHLGLIDMTLSSLGTNGGYGGVLYASYGSSVLLDDIAIDGLSCAASNCYGLVVYSNYGGEVVARDVELTGVKTTSTYEYSSVGALLAYVQYGTLDVDGLEVHDSNLTGNFWGVVYAEGSDVTMRNVDVHDNTFASHYSFSGALVNSYSYGNEQTFENLAFRNNDITFDYSYGQVYGGVGYIEGYGNSDVTVRNVDFSNNSFSGVPLYVYGAGFYTGDGSARIENVVMANNGFADGVYMAGGFLYGYGGDVQVTNVDMSYNDFEFQSTDGGFAHGDWRADMAFTNTNVSTNSFGDVVNGPAVYASYGLEEPDSGVFSWDYGNVFQSGEGPLFVDGSGDSLGLTTLEVDPGHADLDTLELASGSALIDAGDPEILDADGSVSDIGAYGGPGGGSW